MRNEAPEEWFVCDACDGMGIIGKRITVYEPGCAFPRDDTEETDCVMCAGLGGWIVEAGASDTE